MSFSSSSEPQLVKRVPSESMSLMYTWILVRICGTSMLLSGEKSHKTDNFPHGNQWDLGEIDKKPSPVYIYSSDRLHRYPLKVGLYGIELVF